MMLEAKVCTSLLIDLPEVVGDYAGGMRES
jgi:hypothetical protein